MRLPAGASYRIHPSISISAPDGSTSNWVYLSSFDLPPLNIKSIVTACFEYGYTDLQLAGLVDKPVIDP